MKRKFGAMALALSMGLSLTNGVLAADFDDVDESGSSTFDTVETTSSNLSKAREVRLENETLPLLKLDNLDLDNSLKEYLALKYGIGSDENPTNWNTFKTLKITGANIADDYGTPYSSDKAAQLNECAKNIQNLNGLDKLNAIRLRKSEI